MEYEKQKIGKKSIEAVENFLQENPDWGYKNPQEFIIEALRQYIINHTIKLNEYGEVTLPSDILNKLNVKPGEQILFRTNDRGEVIITK